MDKQIQILYAAYYHAIDSLLVINPQLGDLSAIIAFDLLARGIYTDNLSEERKRAIETFIKNRGNIIEAQLSDQSNTNMLRIVNKINRDLQK